MKKQLLKIYGSALILLVFSFLACQQASAATPEDPSVSLVYPTGGESFTAGQKMTIKWNQTKVDTVTIGYKSCPSCLDWITFGTKVDINNTTGSYDWTIPDTFRTSSNYQIEIIAYHTNFGSKVVDSGMFTINAAASQAPVNPPAAINPPATSTPDTNWYKSVVKVKTYMLSGDNMLVEEAEGSGVIINPSGLVLTNDHVVSVRSGYDNSEYDTTFQICLTKNINEKPNCDYLAKLVARDKDKDIALLQIVSSSGGNAGVSFPSLNLSQTDVSQVNGAVTAIGYPAIGEDTVTVTTGIISGKIQKYGNDWIKTDAVIGFGSSGGAAINASGEVIGITSQVSSDVSGELGFVLNSSSIFNWVASNKNLTPRDSSLLNKLINLSKKQKILENSNRFIQVYPYYTIDKPSDWQFEQSSEDAVKIYKQSDQDGGSVVVHLLKLPYLADLSSIKPMLLKSFNDAGLSSVIKFIKEKEVTIHGVKGKLITLSVQGKTINSYVFPQKEYLLWMEYYYGKNDKDKKVVDNIINSFNAPSGKTVFSEVHKYVNSSPKFSFSSNADWAILKQENKANPVRVQNKKIKEAFVTFSLDKMDEATKGLSSEEYLNSKKDENNSTNQASGVIDYKYLIDKAVAHYKLNNNIKDVSYMDGTERTVSQNKILAFDRDYYIKIGDSILSINLTVFTDNKAIYTKALADFNSLLASLSLK